MRRKRFAKKRLLAWLLTMVMVVTLVPSVVSEAAGDYVQCPAGTVTWKKINAAPPGTYFWRFHGQNDENYKYGYYTLTAVELDGKKCVRIENIDKGDTRYLKLKKDDDSGSKYDWGEDSPHRGSSIYRAEASGGEKTETFQVTFNMNGHGSPISPQSVESGKTATEPAKPTAEGYTFVGWYTNSNGTQAYDFNSKVTDDLTLYAVWNYAGGSGGGSWTTTIKGSGRVYDKSWSKDDYTFDVFITITDGKITNITSALTSTPKKSESKTKYHPNAVTAILKQLNGKDAKTTVVDAVSSGTPKYSYAALKTAISTAIAGADLEAAAGTSRKVTFDMNGHGYDIVQEISSGELASRPVDPSDNGYTFGGWYKDSACTTAWNFATPVTTNTILYAKWTEDSDSVQITNPPTATGNDLSLSKTLTRDEASDTYTVTLTGKATKAASTVDTYIKDGYEKTYSYTDLQSKEYYYLYNGMYYQLYALSYKDKDNKTRYVWYFTIGNTKYYLDKTPEAYNDSDLKKEKPGDTDQSKVYKSCKKSKESEGEKLPLYTKNTTTSVSHGTACVLKDTINIANFNTSGATVKVTSGSASTPSLDKTRGEVTVTGYNYSGNANGTPLTVTISGLKAQKTGNAVASNSGNAGIYASNTDSSPLVSIGSPTANIPTTYTYTVAFKAVNGTFHDGTASKTVTLTGKTSTLYLDASDIPAVGKKPEPRYKTGAWDNVPTNSTPITGNTTFTYTYQTDSVSAVSDGKHIDATSTVVVEDTGDHYVPRVTVVVEKGIITDLVVTAPEAGTDNQDFLNEAVEGIRAQIVGRTANSTTAESIDVISGATCASRTLKLEIGAALDAKNLIRWLNYDNSELDKAYISTGTMPEYTAEPPVKSGETFIGWNPVMSTVNGSADYVAQFNSGNLEKTYELEVQPVSYNTDNDTATGVYQYLSKANDPVYLLPGFTLKTFVGDQLVSTETIGAGYSNIYNIECVPIDTDNGIFKTWSTNKEWLELTGKKGQAEAIMKVSKKDGSVPEVVSLPFLVKVLPLPDAVLADGVYGDYSLTVPRYGYKVILAITVENGKITEVTGDADSEATAANREYIDMALEGLKTRLVGQVAKISSADGLDAVSGATTVSNAYILEAQKALSEPPKGPYEITWSDEDGKELGKKTGVKYGTRTTSLSIPKSPEKVEDDSYTYAFKQWLDTFDLFVTENKNYRAAFDATEKEEESYLLTTEAIAWDVSRKLSEQDTNADEFLLLDEGENNVDYIGEATSTYVKPKFVFTKPTGAPSLSINNYKVVLDVEDESIALDGDGDYYIYPTGKAGTTNVTMEIRSVDGATLFASSTFTFSVTSSITPIDNGKYIDGTTPTTEGSSWINYSPVVTVVIQDGKITSIVADPTNKASDRNKTFFNKALQWVNNQLVGLDATVQSIEALVIEKDGSVIDGVSGATLSARCLKAAALKAVVAESTIQWVDEDGHTELDRAKVTTGTIPPFQGESPTKMNDEQYTYTFSGWTPSVQAVSGNQTYVATYSANVNTYIVTWVNDDDTVLETDENVAYGATPTYDGDTPTKASDAQYTYTFAGWTPEIASVTGNVTYTATYDRTVRSYTITWNNYNGTTLKTDSAAYGSTPSYSGATPTKPEDSSYTYTFSGWSPSIAAVTGNATYTAMYTPNPKPKDFVLVSQPKNGRRYLITNEDSNGDAYTLSGDGSAKIYTVNKKGGKYPNPYITVSDDSAVFTLEGSRSAFRLRNSDGKYLKSAGKGNTPVEDSEGSSFTYVSDKIQTGDLAFKVNASTKKYDLQDKGGDNLYFYEEVDPSTSEEYVNYTVTFIAQNGTFEDGSTSTSVTLYGHSGDSLTLDESQIPVAGNHPGTGFAAGSWDTAPNSTQVISSDVTYTYTYVQATYTVTWQQDDGTLIDTTTVAYREIPTHADAAKAPDAQNTYTFKGWTPEIKPATENATYTAMYETTANQYTVTWMNDDGTTLRTDTVAYGATPAYDGETPTKADKTNRYTYTFAGWTDSAGNAVNLENVSITENTTFKARYTAEETGIQIQIEDWTKGAASISGISEDVYYKPGQEVTFTVQADLAAAVAVHTGGSDLKSQDGTFTRLWCESQEDGSYQFSFTPSESNRILTVIFKGDVSLNGTLQTRDASMTGQIASQNYTPTELQKFAADVDGDGSVRTREASMIAQAAAQSYSLKWDLK